MGLRDLFLFAVFLVGVPFMLRQPAVGVMYWVWFSVMNPHRQAYGPAYSFPFAMAVAVLTFIGLIFTREPRRFKGGAAAVVLLAFCAWTAVTTSFALEPLRAEPMLERVLKIQLFTFLAMFVLYDRKHVNWLLGTLVLSIGYYGVKGGLFTVLSGGSYIVWGPEESFIYDNNSLALAVVMSIPLWAYFYVMSTQRWVRISIAVAIGLSAAAALGSQSRGALIALSTVALVLWVRGRHKILLGATVGALAAALFSFMPASWEERMSTIGSYQQDDSAMGRIDTWNMLTNLALDRPLVGGGFEPYTDDVFQRYLPSYKTTHTAHSIYFQILGEQGFVGLALFLLFWLLVWIISVRLIRLTENRPEERWAWWAGRMIQISLLAYLVGGAFLNLAYWDMPYYLAVALIVARFAVRQGRAAAARSPAAAPAGAAKVDAKPPAASPA